MKKVFFWIPRLSAVLYILFISIFALDVFNEQNWFLPLCMHLIPSIFLVVVTFIAWKKPKIGGMFFIILGLLSLIFFHLQVLILSLPSIIIGVVFFMEGYIKLD